MFNVVSDPVKFPSTKLTSSQTLTWPVTLCPYILVSRSTSNDLSLKLKANNLLSFDSICLGVIGLEPKKRNSDSPIGSIIDPESK